VCWWGEDVLSIDAIMNKAFQNGKALWGFVSNLKCPLSSGHF